MLAKSFAKECQFLRFVENSCFPNKMKTKFETALFNRVVVLIPMTAVHTNHFKCIFPKF